jgi:uncharacterized membrane protein
MTLAIIYVVVMVILLMFVLIYELNFGRSDLTWLVSCLIWPVPLTFLILWTFAYYVSLYVYLKYPNGRKRPRFIPKRGPGTWS